MTSISHLFAVPQVIELRRPSDSRLEHVDFDSLFSCLSVRQVIRVFASLLLERRVIFVADKLRWGSVISRVMNTSALLSGWVVFLDLVGNLCS